MRCLIPFVFVLTMASVLADSSTPPQRVHVFATNSPRPDYPAAARKKHIGGAGVFLMHIDPATGDVRSVVVERSTGHKMLDDAAVTAFRQWHWKPGTPAKIRIPLTFTPGRPAVEYHPNAP
jgi:TonB family protein